MVRVVLVTESWSKTVEVERADELIDAEGMSWERDNDSSGHDGDVDLPGSHPSIRYVPAVSG